MTVTLLAALAGDTPDPVPSDVEKLRIFVGELVASRRWHTSEPMFIDQTDRYQNRTVGIAVRYVLDLDPSGAPVNKPRDRLFLGDVLAFVNGLQAVNAKMVSDLELELDGDLVGAIVEGAQDDDLRAWLAAWKARDA